MVFEQWPGDRTSHGGVCRNMSAAHPHQPGANHHESRTKQSVVSVTTCPSGKTKYWSLYSLCVLPAACARAAQRHCPCCPGSLSVKTLWPSQEKTVLASFFSPTQKCFQGSSIALVMFLLMGLWGPLLLCMTEGRALPALPSSKHTSCSQILHFCEKP